MLVPDKIWDLVDRFIYERESDILTGMENFVLLKPVLFWLLALEVNKLETENDGKKN